MDISQDDLKEMTIAAGHCIQYARQMAEHAKERMNDVEVYQFWRGCANGVADFMRMVGGANGVELNFEIAERSGCAIEGNGTATIRCEGKIK